MFCFVLCLLLLFVFLSSLPDGLVILAAVFDDGLRSHWYCTETVRFASVWPAALTDGACAWGRRACNLLPEIVTPHSPRLLNGTCHRSTALVGETNCRAAGHSRRGWAWPRCDTDSGPSASPVVTRDQVSSAPTDIDSTELKQLTNSNTLLEF